MQYNLYWNNICLITKMEEKYLESMITKYNLPILTTYFGLGRKQSMLSKISDAINEEFVDGDIIVSTDTDVVHDSTLLPSLNCFKKINTDFNIHPAIENFISPCGRFVPFIIIPLVVVYNKQRVEPKDLPSSFKDFSKPKYKNKFAFGGLHNSAGKSLLKSIWGEYGENTARSFLDNGVSYTMPAAAFNAFKQGHVDFAIVPTIFANSCDKTILDILIPEEGAIPIPSFIAVKDNVDITQFSHCILGEEFQKMLMISASIVPTHTRLYSEGNSLSFFTPDWDFLHNLDHENFRQLLLSYN